MRRHACAAVAAVLLAATASVDEIDVRGQWQINLECGGFATATSFMNFTRRSRPAT